MPLKNSGFGGPEAPRRTQSGRTGKPGGAVIVVGALLAVLLVNAMFSLMGAGGASRLMVLVVLAVVVACAVGAVLNAAKKRRAAGEEMHADHYRRTRQERPRGSADPCAYSEHHSWQKSQAYDDPWDF